MSRSPGPNGVKMKKDMKRYASTKMMKRTKSKTLSQLRLVENPDPKNLIS
jgi:hypothetical protein